MADADLSPPALASAAATHAAPERMPALDALRGVAIALVLGHHFAPRAELVAAPAVRTAVTGLHIGWAGVDLFFVLSGLLITGILLDGGREPGAMRRFYGRRALRILPLYYATLVVLIAVALALRAFEVRSLSASTLLAEQTWFWLHGANISAAQFDHWSPFSWTQHLWSLAVEEQFYLVWPLVVLATPRRWLPLAIAATVGGAFGTRAWLALAAERPIAAYVLMPARADALAVGAFLALALRTPGWHAAMTRAAAALVPSAGLVLALVVAVAGTSSQSTAMATVGHTGWALLFGALLWLAVVPTRASSASALHRAVGRWQAWLSSRRDLHRLARYSYGVYIVHIPLRALLDELSLSAHDLIPWFGSPLATVLAIVIGTAVSLAVAVPLWHLFESPILQRGGAELDVMLARAVGRRPASTGASRPASPRPASPTPPRWLPSK